jgi:hypothetical protein
MPFVLAPAEHRVQEARRPVRDVQTVPVRLELERDPDNGCLSLSTIFFP